LGKLEDPHPTFFKEKWGEIEKQSRVMHALCVRVLQIIAMGLEIPEDKGGYKYFDELCAYDLPSGDTWRYLHCKCLDCRCGESRLTRISWTDPPPAGENGVVRSETEQKVRIGGSHLLVIHSIRLSHVPLFQAHTQTGAQ
jgi:hypothetical protein